MTGFWEHKTANQNLSFYMLAPFLEEAGRLIRAASLLWHPWSVRRREELKRIAYELQNEARRCRGLAFGWSQHVPALEVPGNCLMLDAIAHSWYYGGDELPAECPEVVPSLLGRATHPLRGTAGLPEGCEIRPLR